LLLVESFDFRWRNQYILVRMIPSCFRFAKMCLCQISLLSRCSPRYLTSSSWGNDTLFIWITGRLVVEVIALSNGTPGRNRDAKSMARKIRTQSGYGQCKHRLQCLLPTTFVAYLWVSSVVFNLGYSYPREQAKTSYGVFENILQRA
jgi:hypothetical protein